MDLLHTHHLDQFMALCLDVHVRLLGHKEALVREGWSEPEAWAWCQRVEERVLGPLFSPPGDVVEGPGRARGFGKGEE